MTGKHTNIVTKTQMIARTIRNIFKRLEISKRKRRDEWKRGMMNNIAIKII